MRLVTTAATATALAAGALLIVVPASGASAATTAAAPGSTCATHSSFKQVQPGQTVAQVEHEMGSVGNPGEGVVTGHGPGTRAFEETWKDCSVAGLPLKGAIVFGVDYQADAGRPLTVVGKTALPPTSLNG